MAELKATPSNATMMAMVKALRSMREGVRPTSEGILPAVGRFATDALLPEGGIDELENWAYGNSPVHVPEMSNIPQFKGDTKGSRGGRALDAAALVPVGSAAKVATAAAPVAKAGLVIPVVKGLNTNAARQADLMKSAKLAEELRGKGAKLSDIWNDTQMAAIPRTLPAGVEHGRWGHEVDFTPEMLRSHNTLTENERLEMAIEADPVGWAKYMMEGGPMPETIQRAIDRPLIREGEYKLPELVDNPELFDQYPALGETNVSATMKTNGTVLGRAGSGNITLYQPRSLLEQDPQYAPFGTLAHETQHIAQDKYGMPRGGQESMFGAAPHETYALRQMLAAAYNKDPALRQSKDPVARALRQLDANAGLSPFGRYANLMGEQQARAAGSRAHYMPEHRRIENPVASWSDPSAGLETPVWRQGRSIVAKYPQLTPEEHASILREALETAYGKP